MINSDRTEILFYSLLYAYEKKDCLEFTHSFYYRYWKY